MLSPESCTTYPTMVYALGKTPDPARSGSPAPVASVDDRKKPGIGSGSSARDIVERAHTAVI